MPYLKIQTNVIIDDDARKQLLSRASQATAEALGKPENYVMVAIETSVPMLFAGSEAPLAFLELKSIGLPESRTKDISRALTGVMEDVLDVAQERVYIEFADASRSMWGWKGSTF